LFEQFEKLGQRLADNIGVTADVHEVRITGPSRDNVNVQMAWQPGPGASAEVHTYVKSVRLYCRKQRLLRLAYQLCQFEQFGIAGLFELGDVPCRCYQQMTVVVWKAVEYDDAVTAAPEHEVFGVIGRVVEVFTDETLAFGLSGVVTLLVG